MRLFAPTLVSLILVCLFCAAPATSRSRNLRGGRVTAELGGTVRSSDGTALSGASVTLREPGSALLSAGTAADNQGAWAIDHIPAGRYVLEVSHVGFRTHRSTIVLNGDEPHRFDIVLDPQAVPESEVVVTVRRAPKALAPVTVTDLEAKDLARQPDMKDLPAALSRLPSTTYYSENGNAMGYSTLRMRGFDQRRLAVAINGIPQNDPEEFNVFWINFFDIQGAVQDIQVQRGAGASVYGPTAIGGAINIRAVPYRPDFHAMAVVGAGAFGTRRYTAEVNSGLLGERFVAFGRLSRLKSDGYRDWSWTEFWRFFGGVTRYGDHSILTVQAYGGRQKDGLAYTGIPKAANESAVTDDFGRSIDRRSNPSEATKDVENFHQPHIEILHEWDMSDTWKLNQSFFWVQGKGYFDFGGAYRSADYLRLPGGTVTEGQESLPLYTSKPDASVLFRAYLDQWQVGWLPSVTRRSDRATTTLGLEGRVHRSLRWGRIQEATGLPDTVVGPENDVRVYSFRGEKAILAAYASHLVRLTDRWAVQGDIQVTWRQYRVHDEAFFGTMFSKSYAFANPRVGVTWNPDHPLSAYASIALAGREPRLKSLYDGEEAGAGFQPRFETNPDDSFDFDRPLVAAEHLVDLELGMKLERSAWRIGLGAFVMAFRNEIIPSGGLDQYGVPRTGNADRTRHAGLELEGALRVAPGLDFSGNLTLSRNRFADFEEYTGVPGSATVQRKGNPIAGFPDVSGNLQGVFQQGAWSVTGLMSFVGRQYVDNGAGRNPAGQRDPAYRVDPYMLVDMSVRYDAPVDGLQLGVDINNLLDRKILSWGNAGFSGPQFFPSATRHAFLQIRYTLR